MEEIDDIRNHSIQFRLVCDVGRQREKHVQCPDLGAWDGAIADVGGHQCEDDQCRSIYDHVINNIIRRKWNVCVCTYLQLRHEDPIARLLSA